MFQTSMFITIMKEKMIKKLLLLNMLVVVLLREIGHGIFQISGIFVGHFNLFPEDIKQMLYDYYRPE